MERFIQASVNGNKFINLSESKVLSAKIEQANQIQIQIQNVSIEKNLALHNDLEDDVEIPNIDVQQTKSSVIYIYFPIGNTESYLTTEYYAKLIDCYPPINWKVEKAFHVNYGTYFKLAPRTYIELNMRESTFISLNNIISTGTSEKLVYVAVRFVNIYPVAELVLSERPIRLAVGFTNDTDFLPIFKTRGEYRIIDFSCNKTMVNYGDTIKVKWKVVGQPQKLLLTPGDYDLRTSRGEMEMQIYDNTTVRLYAIGEKQQVSQPINITIKQPVINSFSTEKTAYAYGEMITFKYDVSGTEQVYINQGIGFISNNSVAHKFSPNQKDTIYKLMCISKEGLISKSITINCTDLLVPTIEFISNGDEYNLTWSISNAITMSVVTSDGSVNSSDATGSKTFKSDASNLYVTIICTGNAGQAKKNVVYARDY